jgi:hypothetical protein
MIDNAAIKEITGVLDGQGWFRQDQYNISKLKYKYTSTPTVVSDRANNSFVLSPASKYEVNEGFDYVDRVIINANKSKPDTEDVMVYMLHSFQTYCFQNKMTFEFVTFQRPGTQEFLREVEPGQVELRLWAKLYRISK